MSASTTPRAKLRVVIATHGELARALLNAVELIAGPQPDIACLCLAAGESPAVFEARLLASLSPDAPALILVDFLGGTPWNAALRIAHSRGRVRVVSGANLPMLLEVALLPRDGLDQLAQSAMDAGIRSIQINPLSLAAHGAAHGATHGSAGQGDRAA